MLNQPTSKAFMPVVLIENFSSEGCSSCPDADKFLGELIHVADSAEQPVYVIDFHVDVWNKSGWVDKYSDTLNTIRQINYIGKMKDIPMYTPQSFLNGILSVPGSDKKSIASFIKQTLAKPSPNFLKINAYQTNKDTVIIDYEIFGKADSLVINFALVENDIYTKVTAGENAGKLLHHHNVVRAFKSEKVKANKGSSFILVPKSFSLKQSRVTSYIQHERTWFVTGADQLVN
ncbi:MAG: DUF1223 domain-containing protein [Bacteroidia bacterium]|nr:DUF1223 domain-containing protein [Bacteroidia bacterium]